MGAVEAAYATLMSNPGALRWPPPPGETGGGGSVASAFATAGITPTATYASQVFTPETLALLAQARTSQAARSDPAAWARSLPDGYGLERIRRELGDEVFKLSGGEMWRLSSPSERTKTVVAALGFGLAGGVQASLLRGGGAATGWGFEAALG
jgi:hypothetical protein